MNALVRFPSSIERLIKLPDGAGGRRALRLARADHRRLHRPAVPGLRVPGQGSFRVIRDSDIEVEEEAEDLVRLYESALKLRRRGSSSASRSRPACRSLRAFVTGDVDVVPSGVVLIGGILGIEDFAFGRDRRPSSNSPLHSPLPRTDPRERRRFLPRSGTRILSSTTLTNPSTSSCNSSFRPRATPTWSRSR